MASKLNYVVQNGITNFCPICEEKVDQEFYHVCKKCHICFESYSVGNPKWTVAHLLGDEKVPHSLCTNCRIELLQNRCPDCNRSIMSPFDQLLEEIMKGAPVGVRCQKLSVTECGQLLLTAIQYQNDRAAMDILKFGYISAEVRGVALCHAIAHKVFNVANRLYNEGRIEELDLQRADQLARQMGFRMISKESHSRNECNIL